MEFERLLSRRALLRAAAGGVAATAIVPLLAACGGDDDDDDDEPTATTAARATSAATGTSAPAAPTATSGSVATQPAATQPAATQPPAASPTTAPTTGGDRLMGKEIEPAGSEGGTLIQAAPYGGETISPFDAYQYAYLVFELLVELHPDTAEPVGNLAEAWEVAADGLTWTFQLRDGVTWHDGEPFTADDVTTTYSIAINPDNLYADSFSAISAVETVDDATVAFTLAAPLVDFIPSVIGIWPIGPDHIWADVEVATLFEDPGVTGADPSRVIGTGPFKFEELVTGDHVTFVRNDDYWDGTPHLDEYVYRVAADPSALSQLLRAGEIDMIPFPPGVDPAAVAELEGADVTLPEFPAGDVQLITFNLDPAKTTLFQDVQVRKAMMHALDREVMVEGILFGYGEVAHSVITPLSWAYDPDSITTLYDFDPEAAAAMLDEAGWVEGSDGIREKDGQKLAFTASVWEANVDSISYAEAIQQFWSDVGIDMQIQVETTAVYFEKFSEARDYEMAIGSHYPGTSPIFERSYACDEDSRIGYCNPELDAILAEAASESDQAKRAELPVGPLAFTTGIAAVSTRVHNMYPNALNTVFNAETWWIEN
jgi:peptide/nickel transport system substrate-binding protein